VFPDDSVTGLRFRATTQSVVHYTGMREILETEEHVPVPPIMYSDPFYRITYLIKEEATQAPGGGTGQVWVNTETHVYHKEGSRWYGKTKHGKYLSEQDTIKEGDHAAKNEKQ